MRRPGPRASRGGRRGGLLGVEAKPGSRPAGRVRPARGAHQPAGLSPCSARSATARAQGRAHGGVVGSGQPRQRGVLAAPACRWVTSSATTACAVEWIRRQVRQLALDEGGHLQDPVCTPVMGASAPGSATARWSSPATALPTGRHRPQPLRSPEQPQQGPTLRELLPVEEFADVRSVSEQALLLHRVLPAGSNGESACRSR